MLAHQTLKRFCSSISILAAALILSGCGEAAQQFDINAAAPKKTPKKPTVMDKNISISATELPVTTAFKWICSANSLPCDTSFQAADRYKVSVNYEGELAPLLLSFKAQTGVDIGLKDGLLQVLNKDSLVPASGLGSCKNEALINLSFNSVPVSEVFKYFSENFGFSFSYDLKFTDLSNSQFFGQPSAILTNGAKQTAKMPKKATFFYTGCNKYDALDAFLTSVDMTSKEVKEDNFIIKDNDLVMFDKSIYFNYKLSGGSQGNSPSPQTVSTGGSSSNQTSNLSSSSISLNEDYKKDTESILAKYISPDGKITFSPRGFVIVEDHPSSIKKIKAIIDKEIQKETPLKVTLNVIRIDLSDDYKAGVDWSAVLGRVNGTTLKFVTNNSSLVGGAVFKGAAGSTDQILSVLQQYGNTRIERSQTKEARSGLLSSFEYSENIPYLTNQTTVSGTSSITQNSETLNYSQSGVTVNVLPNYDPDRKKVYFSVDLAIADYVGDKTFDQGTSGARAIPLIKTSKDLSASEVGIGETLVLTGFKMKKTGDDRQGVPGLSQIPVIGALFGYQGKTSESSDIIITITPELKDAGKRGVI